MPPSMLPPCSHTPTQLSQATFNPEVLQNAGLNVKTEATMEKIIERTEQSFLKYKQKRYVSAKQWLQKITGRSILASLAHEIGVARI